MKKEEENINISKSSVRKSRASSVKKNKTQNQKHNIKKTEDIFVCEKKTEYLGQLMLNRDAQRTIIDIILANLIVVTAVFLSVWLPVVNVALPILIYMYLKIGLWGFVYNKENGNKYKYEDLFVSIKKMIKIFCMYVVKIFLILFWSIMLIVPGIVCMLNYSFTGIIMYESPDLDVKGALMLSKELTYGYRWQIFFYQLLSLTIICVSMSLMFFVLLFFDIFFVVPNSIYIIFVVLAGLFGTVSLALPMSQIAIVDFYILSKKTKTDTK